MGKGNHKKKKKKIAKSTVCQKTNPVCVKDKVYRQVTEENEKKIKENKKIINAKMERLRFSGRQGKMVKNCDHNKNMKTLLLLLF